MDSLLDFEKELCCYILKVNVRKIFFASQTLSQVQFRRYVRKLSPTPDKFWPDKISYAAIQY